MSCLSLTRRPASVCGVVPGSIQNRILLALRAGGMGSSELAERFHRRADFHLPQLIALGFVTRSGSYRNYFYQLTATGQQLVRENGLLSYRAMPISYEGV